VIRTLRAANPNVSILLAKVIPARGLGTEIRAINAGISTLAARMNRAQSPVVLVDLYTGISPKLHTVDGTHLNTIGEQKVANRWFRALTTVLYRYR
jgi:lysophospholipase L1-like esterase